ncbi:hypothetical protein [Tunturiibacter lichenicola]|uniref:hypothetical protein n=1 Tax=Tunturiibacter lichenicola TaxID=2051959 RepID=UPI003D9B173B
MAIPKKTPRSKAKKTPQNRRFDIGLMVSDHLWDVLPRTKTKRRGCPSWPADVFAVAASLLTRKGAYASMLKKWPPKIGSRNWVDEVRDTGQAWRKSWPTTPNGIVSRWDSLMKGAGSTTLRGLSNDRQLVEDLVFLCACSDEACSRVGLPSPSEDSAEEAFYNHAFELIEDGKHGSTLCEEVHPDNARVLPKMHTPQSGLTIRSLSLHLSLITTDEIVPRWHYLPEHVGDAFNVLFVPWPLEVRDGDLKKCDPNKHELDNMPPDFGFFTFTPHTPSQTVADHLHSMLKSKELASNRVHAVVYPELSVTDTEFKALKQIAKDGDFLLISGVRVTDDSASYPCNEVRVAAPEVDTITQQKHHRWKLDQGQIEQYQLQADLEPEKQWWEHIDISSREFMFYAARDGLVFTTLICEDLARPDPVGDLVRAVGPNFVIALLMDGPQLKARWPGRYAASLADDPGSTVLTVTSLGMSLRSLPSDPADIDTDKDRRRVVALWQSPAKLNREIELKAGAEGILLPFISRTRTEWAADGRDDGGKSAYLDLLEPIMVLPASNT